MSTDQFDLMSEDVTSVITNFLVDSNISQYPHDVVYPFKILLKQTKVEYKDCCTLSGEFKMYSHAINTNNKSVNLDVSYESRDSLNPDDNGVGDCKIFALAQDVENTSNYSA